MFVGSITMPQKKGDKRAATEMAQEAPHTQPITCNYSNVEHKGRQQMCTEDGGLSSPPGSGADAWGLKIWVFSAT